MLSSTAISALSSRIVPLPARSLATVLYLAGKFHDAPLFWVDRSTTKPLDWSRFVVTPMLRWKTWQER